LVLIVVDKYGKVAPGPKDAPVREVFPVSRSRAAGAKTIKIRYGPYRVPNMMNKNMVGEKGSLYNLPDVNVEKYAYLRLTEHT
jgi:hypothetical protein